MPSLGTTTTIPGVQGTLVEVKPIRTVQTPAGEKTVQDLKIQEGSDWIFGSAWQMQDLSPWLGKNVIFVSNKGGNNKLAGVAIKEAPSKDGTKVYKNLSISSAATMHDADTYGATRGAAPAPVSAPAPFVPKPPVAMPPQMAPHANGPTPLMRHSEAFPSQATAINGATVGMALKLAGDFIIAGSAPGSEVDRPEVIEDRLHALASMIIRTAARLERGELWQPDHVAPAVNQVMNSPLSGSANVPPPARPRPTPGPGGSAFPVKHDDTPDPDDVPFNGEVRANLVKNTSSRDFQYEQYVDDMIRVNDWNDD